MITMMIKQGGATGSSGVVPVFSNLGLRLGPMVHIHIHIHLALVLLQGAGETYKSAGGLNIHLLT